MNFMESFIIGGIGLICGFWIGVLFGREVFR